MNAAAEVIEKATTGVVEFNQFEHDLAEYKARYQNVVYDLTVPEDDKRARSDRLAIGKTIAQLDRVHKAVKEPLKAQVDLLDGERKRIKDGLLEIQESIKSQIEAHEAAIKAIADALLEKAMALLFLLKFDDQQPTIAVVRDRVAALKATVIDDSYGDQQALAALNKEKSLQVLEPMLLGLEAQEKAAIEAEAARIAAEAKAREEREARIAAEAAENAKREAAEAVARAEREAAAAAEREKQAAIKAEQDAKDAAERAERDKAEAVAIAEAEAKRKAEAAEKARLDAIEKERIEAEKREANTKHCAKINNAAADAITECGCDIETAKKIVAAIARGQIPAVKITY